MNSGYDQTDPQSILKYAKRLVGKTLRQAVGDKPVAKKKGKGGIGLDVETFYFGIKNNSRPEPDFREAGVELKTFPLKKGKGGKLVAKERISLGMIDYAALPDEKWETSSFLHKNSLLLLLAYLHEKGVIDSWDYVFKLAELWRFPDADLKIMRDDWTKIRDEVRAGKAHELSEGATMYLGAVTKSSDSTVKRGQPNSAILAKPRAFSLKQNYVNVVLARIFGQAEAEKMGAAVKDLGGYAKGETFEELIIRRFTPYIGRSLTDLADEFDVNLKAKSYAADITNRILGVKARKVEEFEKAGVTIKTIRLDRKGNPEESMSFPFFRFKDVAKEDWEDSTLRETLGGRFFFVIFRKDEAGEYRLQKVMFWNMPRKDLEVGVRKVWEQTKRCIKSGHLEGFTKSSEDMVAHVRPHGRNAADVDELPSGEKTTKRCFWLNAKYIRKQI